MKKILSKLFWMLAVFSVMFLVSCSDDGETPFTETDDEIVNTEAEIDNDFEDVDNLTLEGMELNVYSNSPDARVAGRRHHLPDCAEISHDFENMIITIDFGDGCELRNGKIISGTIIITYTGRKFVPGTIITTTFENFMLDGKLIEGTRVLENISESLEDNPTFHITLTDGKVTFEDGTFATRESDKTVVWVRAENPLNDEWHILEGSSASGVNVEGIEYSMNVVETIVYKNLCNDEKIKAPVSGVKQVIKGDKEYIVDFGDGECDTLVTITSDGETWTIELKRRHRLNENDNGNGNG